MRKIRYREVEWLGKVIQTVSVRTKLWNISFPSSITNWVTLGKSLHFFFYLTLLFCVTWLKPVYDVTMCYYQNHWFFQNSGLMLVDIIMTIIRNCLWNTEGRIKDQYPSQMSKVKKLPWILLIGRWGTLVNELVYHSFWRLFIFFELPDVCIMLWVFPPSTLIK